MHVFQIYYFLKDSVSGGVTVLNLLSAFNLNVFQRVCKQTEQPNHGPRYSVDVKLIRHESTGPLTHGRHEAYLIQTSKTFILESVHLYICSSREQLNQPDFHYNSNSHGLTHAKPFLPFSQLNYNGHTS